MLWRGIETKHFGGLDRSQNFSYPSTLSHNVITLMHTKFYKKKAERRTTPGSVNNCANGNTTLVSQKAARAYGSAVRRIQAG